MSAQGAAQRSYRNSIEQSDERLRIHVPNAERASREADPSPARQSGMTRKNARLRRGRLDSGRWTSSASAAGGRAPQQPVFDMWRGALTQGEHQADHHRPRVDRVGPAGRGHRTRSGRRRRTEGRQRPSRYGDEPGPRRVHPLPEGDAARPGRRRLGGPRPLRAVRGPFVPHSLHPALPGRLRPGAGRPEVVPHLGFEDPGPPRVRAHRGRGDDDRPAGPGCRQRRRHGDGRPLRARSVRPGGPAGRVALRPLHLRHRR